MGKDKNPSIEKLYQMWKSGKLRTDSDIEDACDELGISYRLGYRVLAQWIVPQQCKGCANAESFPRLAPCSTCTRNATDNFQPLSTTTA